MKLLLKILGAIALLLAVVVIWVVVTLRPNVPEETFTLEPPITTGGLHVLVFGASGNLGLEITKVLVARGDKVTAFVRATSDRSYLEPLGVDFIVGDALDADSVLAGLKQGEFDAVITTIGGFGEVMPDYIGNANIFDAAGMVGIKRVIMISTVGAGNSHDAAPLVSRLALSKILPLKTRAEEHLQASSLDYTIIRPGGLPPGTGTGGGILSEDPMTMGFINRQDLAPLIVGVLDDDRTIGKTLAAIDPARSAPWDDGQ
ncbi:MAG: NAD(P)H-binding protein [Gammaproteobacteria bacterium]|nr:NAD(P)H-binding protein [Gammaproteobacteria bacterium]MCP4088248.1 NAD(P)H-binding protein [Gammaproteobacteria bacterium]MCP4276441.1 NAD(P)H-binding protein [Gammaproteobacteria bacterium]MCP4831088.1 NAD(P)H-binding protein [Gammaproteobacteria bacterium]MCP4929356.1 NAD(P)H-binding protein [Gammaproteobacteria bacterium]